MVDLIGTLAALAGTVQMDRGTFGEIPSWQLLVVDQPSSSSSQIRVSYAQGERRWHLSSEDPSLDERLVAYPGFRLKRNVGAFEAVLG